MEKDKPAKAVYLARNNGENFLVIAEEDGTYRRWNLSDLQAIKVGREGVLIALEIAAKVSL